MKRDVLIFATGSSSGGGSGFANLIMAERAGLMPNTRICGVISNIEQGGVRRHAERLGIDFAYLPNSTCTEEGYRDAFERFGAHFAALSGWLRPVMGLDPRTTFNIHPGPLPSHGGKGMYGHHVHEACIRDYWACLITHSAVSMHFVTNDYDQGPVFFRHPVPILSSDTPDTLGERVNQAEHEWQPRITDKVCSGEIQWDGMSGDSLTGAIYHSLP